MLLLPAGTPAEAWAGLVLLSVRLLVCACWPNVTRARPGTAIRPTGLTTGMPPMRVGGMLQPVAVCAAAPVARAAGIALPGLLVVLPVLLLLELLPPVDFAPAELTRPVVVLLQDACAASKLATWLLRGTEVECLPAAAAPAPDPLPVRLLLPMLSKRVMVTWDLMNPPLLLL